MRPTQDHIVLIHREVCLLNEFLRKEQQIQRQLACEISAIQLWQQQPGRSKLARWISEVTLERRRQQLQAVNDCLERVRWRLVELLISPPDEYQPLVRPQLIGDGKNPAESSSV